MSVELPSSYESIYSHALTQMALGNTDEAIQSMQRIVDRLCRLRPETLQRRENLQQLLISTWDSLVELLRWEKRYDRAIEVSEQVSSHLPDPDVGQKRVASLRIEKGQVEEGLSQLRQIAEGSQEFASWADLAAEYAVLERYEEAEACYQKALSLAQSNEEAAVANLGLYDVYHHMDHVPEALGAWNMAVVLNPDLADHVSQVVAWLIERGDLERAQEYLERDRNRITRAFGEGLLQWERGEEGQARDRWRRVVEMEPDEQSLSVEAWMEAALRLGQPGDVIETADAWLSDRPFASFRVPMLIGVAYLMQGNELQAQQWFERTTRRLQRAWPAHERIPAEQWQVLKMLISEPTKLESAAPYFETGDTPS